MDDRERCNSRQDGYAGLLNGRPYKKAKYAWQVKGGRPQSVPCSDAIEDGGCSEVSSVKNSASNNMDDRLRAVAIHDSSVAAMSRSPIQSRSFVDLGSDCKYFGNEPVHHPSSVLHKWQSKQMAQSIIDNAINNVLGEIANIDSRSMRNSYSLAVDAAYDQVDPLTWSQYLNSQNVVNEGVAEAIRQQGLQRWADVKMEKDASAVSISSSLETSGFSDVIKCTTFILEDNQNNSEAVIETAGLESDDLLAKAVNCAITRKGLSMLVEMPQQ